MTRTEGNEPMLPSRSRLAPAATLLAAAALAGAIGNAGAASSPAAPWDRLRWIVGAWRGVGQGQPGASTVDREYRFVLGDRFLEVRNTSTYPPQERDPKGELHEDRGFISWDRARQRFVPRQFHVEGFVNTYVADSLAATGDSIVFRSEAIENIPPGYRARETYRLLGPDEFAERFEMAEPGQEFEVYSQAKFTRAR